MSKHQKLGVERCKLNQSPVSLFQGSLRKPTQVFTNKFCKNTSQNSKKSKYTMNHEKKQQQSLWWHWWTR